MIDVQKQWPNCQMSGGAYNYLQGKPSNYDIVEAFGEVLVDVSAGDYQGDILFLLKGTGTKYGIVCVGYGSCSGCDALEGANSIKDLQDWVDTIEHSIKWFPNTTEVLKYLREHDWQGDYTYHWEEMRVFPERAIAEILKDPIEQFREKVREAAG